MTESLSRIFRDNLFKTRKPPANIKWEKIAERAGEDLYEEVSNMFPDPEVALCAVLQATAEIISLQPDKIKRRRIIDRVKDVLKETLEVIEKEEEEEGEEGEADYPGEKDEPVKKGAEPEVTEEEEPEEEEEEEEEVDLADNSNGDLPGEDPRPSEDDDDNGVDDDDPDESWPKTKKNAEEAAEESPAKAAGFQLNPPKRRGKK